MRVARRVLAIAAFVGLLVGGWVFAARHPQAVSIDYFLGQTRELPLWIALLVAVALGAAVAGGALGYQLLRLAMLARRYRRAVQRLELEIHELRNLPLDPDGPAVEDALPPAPPARALPRGG
ncbi:MAG TPA: lipopolysaccharide assembly protein LapA domain-containing protein [Myxococcota bacterium]|nr:lipopolysaccharide assembly protein LapA domain-containing protein [Myxococcota bacterium]